MAQNHKLSILNVTSTDGVSSVSSVFDSRAEKQILAAVYGFICFAGVLGNSVVLLAVVLSRKPRTTTSVFVVNLAVADLISCLSLPISVLAMLSEDRQHLLVSESLCAFQGFVLVVCIGCSMNNIAIIAVYRVLITRRTNHSRLFSVFNRRGLIVIVATSWLIPFVVGLLPIVSVLGSYGYDEKLSTCTYSPTAHRSDTFSKIMVTVYYPVQLVVTFSSYAVIFYTVRRHNRRVEVHVQPVAIVGGDMRIPPQPGIPRQPHPSPREDVPPNNQLEMSAPNHRLQGGRRRFLPVNRPPSRAAPRQGTRRQFRRSVDITLTLFLVVFFFVLCFTPYSAFNVLYRDKSQKIAPFLGGLVVCSNCINPVIYTARHPDFKAVIRRIMLCQLSKIPMKSSFLRKLLGFRGG